MLVLDLVAVLRITVTARKVHGDNAGLLHLAHARRTLASVSSGRMILGKAISSNKSKATLSMPTHKVYKPKTGIH
jgi:hypothetical protein